MYKHILSVFLIASITLGSFRGMAQNKTDQPHSIHESITLKKEGTFPKDLTIHIHGDKITVNGKTPENIDVIRKKSSTEGESITKLKEKQQGTDAPSIFEAPFFNQTNENRPLLGVITLAHDSTRGAKIAEVEIGTAADSVGLQDGDIIVAINDQTISSSQDLSKTVNQFKPGDKISVTYLRDQQKKKVDLTLGQLSGNRNSYAFHPNNRRLPFHPPSFSQRNQLRNWLRHFHPQIDRDPNIRMRHQDQVNLGVIVENFEQDNGTSVEKVIPKSAAAEAGLKEGDIIKKFGGESIGNISDLQEAISNNQKKDDIKVQIIRDNNSKILSVSLEGKKKRARL